VNLTKIILNFYRTGKKATVTISLLLVLATFAVAQAGTLDTSFADAKVFRNGSVDKLLIQPDGKIIIGGIFTSVGGQKRVGIARLNTDGTPDSFFIDPNITGSRPCNPPNPCIILAITLQSDGKILVGGYFTSVNGQSRSDIVRLNSNGTLDSSFQMPNVTGISAISVQSDGKILIGGSFTSVNGQTRNNVARLNADGSLDAGFTNPNVNGSVSTTAIQTDGKILIGGYFTLVGGQTRHGIARLNSDGTLDNTFNQIYYPELRVNIITIQSDGKIIFGSPAIFGNFVRRLNADGSLDVTFTNVNFSGIIGNSILTSIATQSDGKILVTGSFGFVNSQARNGLARLNSNGSLDTNFNPNVDVGIVLNFFKVANAFQSNGKIIIGGVFTSVGNQPRHNVARLNNDGAVDNVFTDPNIFQNGIVYEMAIQPDGKIIIGGDFISVGGHPRNYVARLNSDGSLDESFIYLSATYNIIDAIGIQTTGKILISGRSSGLIRLNSNGTVDNSFTQNAAQLVRAISVQPNDKILIGGDFTLVAGQPRRKAARLNSDGTLDLTFGDPNVNVSVNTFIHFVDAITFQPDGKVLIGGFFDRVGGQPRNNIARLNFDGTLDNSFAEPNLDGQVSSFAIQPDGKIFVGGYFTSAGIQPRSGVARLNSNGTLDSTFVNPNINLPANEMISALAIQSDGKLLVGGTSFSTVGGQSRLNVARLNNDGTLDTSFISPDANGTVNAILLQSDGKVLIGGGFNSIRGQTRFGIARLNVSNPRRSPFDFDGDGKADISVFRPADGVWYRLQSQSGFRATQFGISTDKLAPADYDGDGRTDLGVYRDGVWYLLRSQAGFAAQHFGLAGDIPQPADFDGDGRAELVVYRGGYWYVWNLVNSQFTSMQFGVATDKPVVGDYDGDGKADYAVYRPSDGVWYMLRSQTGFRAVQFGVATDKIVPADYDGDGKTDQAVYRNGIWYINRSQAGFAAWQFGLGSDLPAPADYDGDGKADVAVFRSGNWYVSASSNGNFSAQQFGVSNDRPIPAAFVQ
jgi:uncharacterized delta-60 repeat protein